MSKLLKALAALSVVVTMGAAQASLISGSLFTNGGKAVNLSGLEWLSFDDSTLGTFNVSRDTVEAAGSAWMTAGWRYATAYEYSVLIDSLGITGGGIENGYFTTNNDGVDFLLSTWGRLTIPGYDSIQNPGLENEARRWGSAYSFHQGMFGGIIISGVGLLSHLGFVQSPILHGLDYVNDALYQDVTS